MADHGHCKIRVVHEKTRPVKNTIGFHADNGSEYINRWVTELLEKLHVELTKSRSRHYNDNALVESKNASVVRKVLSSPAASQSL
ncbi:MAG: hypothetical protein AB7F20_11295 [Geoalkalibacter sp.]|uniref:hypothetical protein n=1 Tax=Geoalkalibacter sp. TaxID=3041440 RepID=UPI003D0C3DC1